MQGAWCQLGFFYYVLGPGPWRMPAAICVAAIATFLLAYPVRRLGYRLGAVDVPKALSSHTDPVPRTGGVAVLLGVIIGIAFVFKPTVAFLVTAAVGGVVVGISFLDDLRSLSPIVRLVIQILVAALTVGLIGLIPEHLGLPYVSVRLPEWLGFMLATVYVVGFMNAFNFMDGIDGLATSQGMWGAAAVSLLLYYSHSGNSVYTAAALAGACLGFLPHNFPRARIFLGDSGAISIGFGLVMLTLLGAARTRLPWVACALPLIVCIYDTGFTVIKRIAQGASPFERHREFHFHLLLRSGWDHDQVTRLDNAMIIGACIAGWIYAWHSDAVRLIVLCCVAFALGSYSILVHRYFAKHRIDAAPAATPEHAAAGTAFSDEDRRLRGAAGRTPPDRP